jgi:hypothetical protein
LSAITVEIPAIITKTVPSTTAAFMHQATFPSFASNLKAKQSFLLIGRILNFTAPFPDGKLIAMLQTSVLQRSRRLF